MPKKSTKKIIKISTPKGLEITPKELLLIDFMSESKTRYIMAFTELYGLEPLTDEQFIDILNILKGFEVLIKMKYAKEEKPKKKTRTNNRKSSSI